MSSHDKQSIRELFENESCTTVFIKKDIWNLTKKHSTSFLRFRNLFVTGLVESKDVVGQEILTNL